MVSRTELANKPYLQLILIASLVVISWVLFAIIGVAVSYILYGLIVIDLDHLANANKATIDTLKLLQLFSAIGVFILPPIIYALITSKNPFKKLGLKKFALPINYGLIILLMVISIPVLSWIVELNANMVLPDFLNGVEQWMKQSEKVGLEQTKAFLSFNGFGSLIYILVIVAVVPALGEELLFRGVLQKIFIQWTKNPHWGIWITAILFSAIHMQFYGFLPRMLLGAFFGYLFFWSKSLWLPILGHFINNGSVVIFSFIYPESIENADVAVFEDSEYQAFYYVLSLLLSLMILYTFRKVNSAKNKVSMNTDAEIN